MAPDEDLKTTYDFINKSVKPIDRKAIVTDLKSGYDSVMKKLGFKHQHCIYHLRLAINERIKKFLKQKDIELRIQFKKENEKISEYKLNKKVKKEIENLKDEINIYKQLFFELFEQQKYDKAISYIDLLRNEIDNFPEVLKNYLIKDFSQNTKNSYGSLKMNLKEN